VADKPILKLPVDSEDFDALLKKIENFKKDLGELPEAWAKQDEGVKLLSSSFEMASNHFNKIKQDANDTKLTGNSSFISRFEKSSDKAEKSWGKMTKWISDSQKNLTGIARMAIISSSRGGLFGAAAGGVLGLGGVIVGGTVAAAGALADQNIRMRGLGLRPGEESAFTTEYAKYAGGEDAASGVLDTAAAAKRNPVFAQPLNAIGISNAEVNKMTTTELAQAMMEKIGPAFNAHNQNGMGELWMKNTGLSQLLNPETAQRAGTYGQSDFAQTREEFATLNKQLALNQDAYDKGTEALKRFVAALKEDETSILQAFTPLLDPLSTLAKEFSDAVVAFAKSGELMDDVDAIGTAFKELSSAAEWVSDKLNDLFGFKGKPEDKDAPDFHLEKGGVGARLWWGITHPFTDTTHMTDDEKAPGADYNWMWHNKGGPKNAPVGTGGNYYDVEKKYGLPQGLLEDINHIEDASGNPQAENPITHAKGNFQLMPDTAKRFGVDPTDTKASADAAGQIMRENLKKYNGDLAKAIAAYDGDTHIDADTVKYNGDWLKGAKPETLAYLKKMQGMGMDLGTHVQDMKEAKGDYARSKAYQSQVANDQAGNAPQMPGVTDHILSELSSVIKHLDTTVTSIFREGGGSAYRSPDSRTAQRIDHQGNQSMRLKVDVITPPGTNVNVTNGGTAQ
jgi:hypothetical protein